MEAAKGFIALDGVAEKVVDADIIPATVVADVDVVGVTKGSDEDGIEDMEG